VHEEAHAVVSHHCTETLSLTLVLVRLLSHAGTGDSHSPRNSSGAVVVFGALLLLYHPLHSGNKTESNVRDGLSSSFTFDAAFPETGTKSVNPRFSENLEAMRFYESI
jgi:hypothetical protein